MVKKSFDALDYPAGQAHLTVVSGRFRIDGRDQELERGAPTVEDKNIHLFNLLPSSEETLKLCFFLFLTPTIEMVGYGEDKPVFTGCSIRAGGFCSVHSP